MDCPIGFDIDKYELYRGKATKIVKGRDILDLGSRRVEVIYTPGHSPGHICLYDIDKKYLFCGDLIYKGTLYAFYPTTDPVAYMESVKKIKTYDVKKLLPSHYDLNISTRLIREVYEGFCKVEEITGLKQGSGIFDFGEFKIHI